MPYYCCPACGVTSYSAAGYSSVGVCPECSTPLLAPSTSNGNGQGPPEPAYRRRFPARPGAAPEARRAIEALGLPDEERDALRLMASELVTNAVRHAGSAAHDPAALDGSIDLVVTRSRNETRLAVRDEGPGFTPPEPPEDPNHGGLGFVIIDALSNAWGVIRHDRGCTVWCTLATSEPA